MTSLKFRGGRDCESQRRLLGVHDDESLGATSWALRWIRTHYKILLAAYVFTGVICACVGATLSCVEPPLGEVVIWNPKVLRRWGGFGERPTTNRCYRQERTAMLLALYLGSWGVDQWYAHHWVLATSKMLCTVIVQTTAAHAALRKERIGGLSRLLLALVILWKLVDITLWIVGGVYGTPGCPGGSSDEWRY